MPSWSPHRRSSQKIDHSATYGPLAVTCLQIVDIGLGAIIFVGPHLFGGRHPLGRFAILSLCTITAIAWFTRQLCLENPKWRSTWPFGLLLVASSWLVLQLTPLPSDWLDQLSPRLVELLPLWTAEPSPTSILGTWKTLSLCPEETRLALAALLAYGMLFVTVVQRIENVDDVKRLFRWIATSAMMVAGFGILQYFTSNGKFFWFYEHPYTDTLGNIKGGFSSRNHFAHFLVLGLSTMFSWGMMTRNSKQPTNNRTAKPTFHHTSVRNAQSSPSNSWVIVGIVITIFAVVACLSRGGLLAMGSATFVSILVFARLGLIDSSLTLAGSVLMLVIVGSLSISGDYNDVAKRMDTLASQSMDELDASGGRRLIWSANLAAIRSGWLTGSGAGTHRFIYPAYTNQSFSTEFTHAENGYLQLATENGLPGIIFLIVIIISCMAWCVQCLRSDDREIQILVGGIAAALAASLVHSIVDFVWYIPACITITIILVGCCLRLSQLACSSPHYSAPEYSISKISTFNWALAITVAGSWAVITLFPLAKSSLAWDKYALSHQAAELASANKLALSDRMQEQLDGMQQMNCESQCDYLAAVVRDYPNSATAQILLASALLSRFENQTVEGGNAMSISQIREAAQASRFASAQELCNWLKLAFGEKSTLLYRAHYHARQAAKLCPLQAEAYICLAELCFLEGKGNDAYKAYVNQGLKVDPYNPTHLFGAGKNFYIAGDRAQAYRLWQTAFAAPGSHQEYIIQILVHELSAHEFIKIFSPDWNSLDALWQAFESQGAITELKTLVQYATRLTVSHTPRMRPGLAGKTWLALSRMQLKLNEHRAALNSLQQACTICPESFPIRHEFARCLLACQQFELAEIHLRWCIAQAPENQTLQAELLQVSRIKVARLTQGTGQRF